MTEGSERSDPRNSAGTPVAFTFLEMPMTLVLLRPRARALGAFGLLMSLLAASPLAALERAAPATVQQVEDAAGDERPKTAKAAQARRRTGRGRRTSSPRRRPAAAKALPALRPTTPRSASALANDLASLLYARTRSGTWGVLVVSLTRGDTLFSVNPDALMLPASTLKLYTAALAFDRFGPAHQFSTDVLRHGSLAADGTLNGNLILRGGGDPALSSRFVRGTSNSPMDVLASLVAGTGVKRVRGDLIADATAFEARRVPEGWLPRYLESGYAARVSALSLNENLATVVISPTRGGAIVSLEPASSSITLVNKVRVVGGSNAKVSVRRLADGSIQASGTIGVRSAPRYYQVVVDDPALFTAGAFRSALAARGITVDGTIRMAPTPVGAAPVTSLPSPPLTKLASVMNRESINHYAELLFRNAARESTPDGLGSAEAGNALLARFMSEKVGSTPGTVFAADGSGLSTLDRITPRSLVQLLGYAHKAPWGADFHASLPVAGESELLRHRMRYTPAQGNLHAKTGTTNDVIALGGYVTAHDGEVLAFSYIYNGRDRWNAREAIDASGATLAAFVRDRQE